MAASSDLSWMEEVKKKLIATYESDPDTLVRILFYLDEEDKVYKMDEDGECPPVYKTLKATMHSDVIFKKYTKRLAQDTKKAEMDQNFRKMMRLLYKQMMEPSDEPLPEDNNQGFDMVRSMDVDVAKTSACLGLARAWSLIPQSTRAEILEGIPHFITRQLANSADEVIGLYSQKAAEGVMIGLAAIYLSYVAIKNLWRWWKGEISGVRCTKNIVDASFTVGAGAVGGLGGAALGAFAGPVGMLVGGVIGGIVSSSLMGVLSDRMTQWLFGIPKDEALENAYRFLGVQQTASNHEINTAFRQLCLKHHPDKPGGTKEDFFFLQLNMGVIKVARGELL